MNVGVLFASAANGLERAEATVVLAVAAAVDAGLKAGAVVGIALAGLAPNGTAYVVIVVLLAAKLPP